MNTNIHQAEPAKTYIVNAMFLHAQREKKLYLSNEEPNAEGFITLDDVRSLPVFPIGRCLPSVTRHIVQEYFVFESFRLSWLEQRGATSSITEMAMCPSYQSIIAMGPSVIPLILRRMENEGDEPDMWFWALRVLTGIDPITNDDRGDIVKMAQAWLTWARDRYVW